MSKFDYFRARAAAYRRMAMDAKDDRMSADMHELAAIFDSIAATCEKQRSAGPLRQRLFSGSLLIRRIFAR
jgi:hypothetical protein